MTMHQTSDQELIAASARKKDESAFAELLEWYAGMVFATAKRCTSNVESANEITQIRIRVIGDEVGETPLPFLHGRMATSYDSTGIQEAPAV